MLIDEFKQYLPHVIFILLMCVHDISINISRRPFKLKKTLSVMVCLSQKTHNIYSLLLSKDLIHWLFCRYVQEQLELDPTDPNYYTFAKIFEAFKVGFKCTCQIHLFVK